MISLLFVLWMQSEICFNRVNAMQCHAMFPIHLHAITPQLYVTVNSAPKTKFSEAVEVIAVRET